MERDIHEERMDCYQFGAVSSPEGGAILANLVRSGEAYHAAVKGLFEIDPNTKKCFAEGSPTRDEECYQRFVEFNTAVKRFSAALCAAKRQVPA